ncbi:hypothetical protein D5086_012414 [Populus alba]|uniref:Uncharacterized protein n=1 Tax=Populus alba TaxID=43335 RepID=A0ACC4C2V5_POPAL
MLTTLWRPLYQFLLLRICIWSGRVGKTIPSLDPKLQMRLRLLCGALVLEVGERGSCCWRASPGLVVENLRWWFCAGSLLDSEGEGEINVPAAGALLELETEGFTGRACTTMVVHAVKR